MKEKRKLEINILVLIFLGGTNYVALVAGVVCIAGLLLPTEGERNQRIPEYLHLSINFKLIFSFVLGELILFILLCSFLSQVLLSLL